MAGEAQKVEIKEPYQSKSRRSTYGSDPNVGSIRAKDRREDAFDADIDIFAFQETSADIKTIHDAKTEFGEKQFRTIWSEPVEIHKQVGGALVTAAAAPLYCTQFTNHTRG